MTSSGAQFGDLDGMRFGEAEAAAWMLNPPRWGSCPAVYQLHAGTYPNGRGALRAISIADPQDVIAITVNLIHHELEEGQFWVAYKGSDPREPKKGQPRLDAFVRRMLYAIGAKPVLWAWATSGWVEKYAKKWRRTT